MSRGHVLPLPVPHLSGLFQSGQWNRDVYSAPSGSDRRETRCRSFRFSFLGALLSMGQQSSAFAQDGTSERSPLQVELCCLEHEDLPFCTGTADLGWCRRHLIAIT